MLSFIQYLRFQYLFWKLHSTYRLEEEWVINEESITLLKACFQLIPDAHFKRLNRKYLQTISTVTYTGGLKLWFDKCDQANDNLLTFGSFPSSWGYLPEEKEMSLEYYLSSDGYWREPKDIIVEVFAYLDNLLKLVQLGGKDEVSYRFRKMNKLFSEAIGYLTELLFQYKENQYVKERRESPRVTQQYR